MRRERADGTISGATWTPQGKFGSALLQRFNNWVTVASSSLLNLTAGMTLEAWILSTATSGTRDVIVKEGSNLDSTTCMPATGGGVRSQTPTSAAATAPPRARRPAGQRLDSPRRHLRRHHRALVRQRDAGRERCDHRGDRHLHRRAANRWQQHVGRVLPRHHRRGAHLQPRPHPAEIQADMVTPIGAAAPTSPVVAITAPGAGAQLSGMVTLSANATDDEGIAGVTFLVDGSAIGPEDSEAPFAVSWDTSSATVGMHTLTARARDTSGNLTLSAAVSVEVVSDPVPGQFIDEVVLSGGLTFPTSFEFLPDGRMLVTEFQGRILIAQAGANVVDPTPVIQFQTSSMRTSRSEGSAGWSTSSQTRTSRRMATSTRSTLRPLRSGIGWPGSRWLAIRRRLPPSSSCGRDKRRHPAQTITAAALLSDRTGSSISPRATTAIRRVPNPSPPITERSSGQQGRLGPVGQSIRGWSGTQYRRHLGAGAAQSLPILVRSATARMYIGDVGQNTFEEVNVGVAGANYGWPPAKAPAARRVCETDIPVSHNGRDSAITGDSSIAARSSPPASSARTSTEILR